MKKIILLVAIILVFNSCTESTNEKPTIDNPISNKVLILKVDYTTNSFEGGKELDFAVNSQAFTPNVVYQSPGDFGSIKVFYSELNTQIFNGTIIWNGEGQIQYPTDFLPKTAFYTTNTLVALPLPVIQNIFNPNNQNYDYTPIFGSVIYLSKVMQYRQSNPNASAKIFLYTPGVGDGNTVFWKWIIMFKN